MIPPETNSKRRKNFLTEIIDADLSSGKHDGIVTRFPPEPNGYLHIGHAKAIAVNFGLARDYRGRCHLRLDDTNPTSEDEEFARAIENDIRWLGFDWGDNLFYASDYFDELYRLALELIDGGKAYIDSSSEEEIRQRRGTLNEAGTPSPYRDRSIAENKNLFQRMRDGEFEDGAMVLRAKIDMSAANMKMRDPLLYRIRKNAHHYRTGDQWPIYPMYDFAHCLSDAIEGITHSLCTLEFENNRELYDWLIDALQTPTAPHQYEFARLGLDYTVMSKRKLKLLVEEKYVSGWDDPRMPTLAGLRRRGFPPTAILRFCDDAGVAKTNSTADVGKLEYTVRDELNHSAPRAMAVLRPLKVVLTNLESGHHETLTAQLYPDDVGLEGTRALGFSNQLWIERDDFQKAPEAGFKRLAPGRSVRLRHGYIIRCDEVIANGDDIAELRCTVFLDTLGTTPAGHTVSGVIHWVDANSAVDVEVRLYDRLFSVPNPDKGDDFRPFLNPESLTVCANAKADPSLAGDGSDTRYQFERLGYFWRDPDSVPARPVFNRIITLRDTWSKRKTQFETALPPRTGKGAKSKTRPQKRSKAEWRQEARRRDPSLASRYKHYREAFGLSDKDADLLTGETTIADFFDRVCEGDASPDAAAKWMVNDVLRELKSRSIAELPFGAHELSQLVALSESGTIGANLAKQVFAEMANGGGAPDSIAERLKADRIDNQESLASLVDGVLTAHPGQVAAYRSGKTGLLGFLVGQAMKACGGKANPRDIKALLSQRLDAGE